jgi:hypothetical protein
MIYAPNRDWGRAGDHRDVDVSGWAVFGSENANPQTEMATPS